MSRDPTHVWSRRIEDDALLRGRGRFGDDVRPEGAAAAVFVRSPHAHARMRGVDVAAAHAAAGAVAAVPRAAHAHRRMRGIDVAAANAVPGVLAVITGADLAAENFATLSQAVPLPGRGGK